MRQHFDRDTTSQAEVFAFEDRGHRSLCDQPPKHVTTIETPADPPVDVLERSTPRTRRVGPGSLAKRWPMGQGRVAMPPRIDSGEFVLGHALRPESMVDRSTPFYLLAWQFHLERVKMSLLTEELHAWP